MKSVLRGVGEESRISRRDRFPQEEDQLHRQVTALYSLLANLYGSDKLVMKAGKLDALQLMRSKVLEERVLALQRLVYEDPTLAQVPKSGDIPTVLDEIEEEIADLIARKTVEEKIEKKIAERMQHRHEEYVKEIRLQVLKEINGPDNPYTLKKYAELEKMEQVSLSRSALEKLRPSSLDQVVGQEAAVRALLAKLVSPFPQHVIVYGPPGVGKTTVARLVLEEAKKIHYTPFAADAPFIEVDGTTLRWDPREVTNPLLGSVHDPIYQGARRDLAEGAIPEPKPGLVTEAHGGVLFIDEIGEMDHVLMNKLLKVLEDKRVKFDSAYYDPDDPGVPKYIKKLFEEGAPADFILIAATTKDPAEISPALRSRCAEVYFEPLTNQSIKRIVTDAARRLDAELDPEVAELISIYSIEGRKAVGMLADAYGIALYQQAIIKPGSRLRIREEHLMEVIRASRLSPYITVKGSADGEIGKVFGLGVSGFVGSLIEIEAVSFPAEKGKGKLRFNETAGSMAKDSVFNAASVVRLLTGLDITDYDIHVNIVGGGRIDGPSAGVAITLAIVSCLLQRPLRQDVAITGEVTVQGKVKEVGGIPEKIYGAKQAGVNLVYIPRENERDIPSVLDGITVKTASTVKELMEEVFFVH